MSQKPKILIVDDDLGIRELVITTLEPDYEFLEAGDGAEALQIANKERPNLIILDVMLPQLDGFSVCRELKTKEQTRSIPVIMLTVKRSINDKVTGLNLGADDFLSKPFDPRELAARVKSQLTIKDLNDQLVQLGKLGALREMVVSLNHEINNPLSSILINAQLLLKRLGENDKEIHDMLTMIIEEGNRIKEITHKLSNLTRVVAKDYIPGIKMIDLEESAKK
jgi:DNA-binding response OmpR family regulator